MLRASVTSLMMARPTPVALARAYMSSSDYAVRKHGFLGGHPRMEKREGKLGLMGGPERERKVRQALHSFATDAKDRRRLTDLPGVEFDSQLPADPLTRIFFQRKGDQALFQGTYEDPSVTDPDRVQIARRTIARNYKHHNKIGAVFDFCHRVREGTEQRKRFVTVPSTVETRGIAEIMRKHGLLAGMRDFFNDRAFVVELKYFQNESVIMCIEPATRDMEQEMDWTPRVVRAFGYSGNKPNNVRLFILRTWDGRILSNQEASKEGIGGRALCLVY